MRYSALFLLCTLLAGRSACAQQAADSILLKDVVITAPPRSDLASGLKVQEVDSATMAHFRSADLSTLLAHESPIFIKSYGQGSLATTSFRGGSANHTAILWNGFNLGSPMTGQIDLSLIPVGLADHVRIQYGGAGALWGSGAVGGSVQLNSSPGFGQGLTVEAGTTFGSFGDRRQRVHVALGKQRWASSIRLFNAAARNDFEYVNTTERGSPKQRQQHAETAQYGVLAEQHYRINTRQRINARLWYQHNDRNVPPTLLQEHSTARQQDESWRITTEWQRTGDKVKSHVRAAGFEERLHWHGMGTDSAAYSRSRTFIAEAEMRIALARGHQLHLGWNNTFAQASSEGLHGNPEQYRTALFAAYRFSDRHARSETTLSLRQEAVAGELVPFTWSVGSAYTLRKGIVVKGNVSRVYRLPTFNDLYWTPGGNPALLPESGYSGELGLAAKGKPARGLEGTAEATLFQRSVDNWIIWLPRAAYWSPMNIMHVWSRGVELRGTLSAPVRRTTIKLHVMTNYVVSTNQTATTVNDASVDKQLIYVPVYSGHGRLSVGYKELLVTAGASYTGYRYTSTDNREFLEPYVLVDAALAYRLTHGRKYVASLHAQCNNLLDARYEVMRSRPMPLRNFQVGLSLRFNQPLRPQQPLP